MSAAIHIDLDEDSAAPAGYVVIAVRGGDPASPNARFTLRRFGFGNDHLGPNGWVPGETPLTPERVVHTADGAKLFIAPGLCRYVNADQLVEFGFLGDGVTCTGRAKLLWPDTPSPTSVPLAPPPSSSAPTVVQRRPPAQDDDDEFKLDDDPPPPPRAAAAHVSVVGNPAKSGGSSLAKIALIAVAVLAGAGAAGGGAWYFFVASPPATTTAAATAAGASTTAPVPAASRPPGQNSGQTPGQTAAGASAPGGPAVNTREQVAALIKTQPPSVAAFAEAERLARAGTTDGAFLLFRYAADKGHAPSMIAIGRMYDPLVADAAAQKFVRPSAETALSWYKKAGTEPEAQWLAGRLLLKGGQDLPADKAAAKEFLQKAAAAGNADAKQLLPSAE